jgi:hypothetical protein
MFGGFIDLPGDLGSKNYQGQKEFNFFERVFYSKNL